MEDNAVTTTICPHCKVIVTAYVDNGGKDWGKYLWVLVDNSKL